MEAKLRAGNSGHRCRRPVELRHRGLGRRQPHRADRLREAARLREGRLEPAVHGPGVRQGQRRLDPEELGHDRHRLPQLRVPGGVTTWKQFFEVAGTTYDGKTLIVDHQISSFGSAAVAMGYSLNTIDATEMAAVEAMLTALKPKLFAISSDVQPPLRAEDTWLSIAWTGDGVQVGRDNDGRQVRRRDRWRRALDRQLHGRRGCPASRRRLRVPQLHPPAGPGRGGDGVLPLPARQRQGDGAAAGRDQGQRGHLPPGRLAREARVRRQRDVQQPRARRGVGPHQGFGLRSLDDGRERDGDAPPRQTAWRRRPARGAGRALVPRVPHRAAHRARRHLARGAVAERRLCAAASRSSSTAT